MVMMQSFIIYSMYVNVFILKGNLSFSKSEIIYLLCQCVWMSFIDI